MADHQAPDRGGIPEGAVVVGAWRRRVTRTAFDTVRLIRAEGRWFVRRRVGPQTTTVEYPNLSCARLAIAALIGDAWVYYPPAQRRPIRHTGRRDPVAL